MDSRVLRYFSVNVSHSYTSKACKSVYPTPMQPTSSQSKVNKTLLIEKGKEMVTLPGRYAILENLHDLYQDHNPWGYLIYGIPFLREKVKSFSCINNGIHAH